MMPTLFWWIDSIRISGGYYRYWIGGQLQDVAYPGWPDNGRGYFWNVPSLRTSGGRYVFRLRVIT
jgi:hypothetical protein